MSGHNTYTIETEEYLAEIKTLGAEPCRVYHKTTTKELLWNGNPKYWKRHSPILFPIVGKVFNGKYQVNNKAYELSQHGFARDMEWELIKATSNSIEMRLQHSEETLKRYPYQFEIHAIFSLDEEGFHAQHKVINPSATQELLFCIGAHPAFNTPNGIDQYHIVLDKKEVAEQILLTPEGYRSGKRKAFFENSSTLPLREEIFKNDALIFDDFESKQLKISHNSSNESITVSWSNYPHMGIWKPLGAPFLCIEPWQGMADKENFNSDLSKKFGVDCLQPGKEKIFSWNCSVQ